MDMWFLVQTKPRQERRAVENLERQGVMSFCPVVNMGKISRGRRMVVEEVLFPGYLFVNFNQHKVSATSIRSTRGVSQFVSFSGKPVHVPEELISGLKQRVAFEEGIDSPSLPKPGDRLEILEGPFRGLNGVFSQPDGNSRAIILINLLNQQVKASMPLCDLKLNKVAE
jgi:transcriptional antiterminator RfaH